MKLKLVLEYCDAQLWMMKWHMVIGQFDCYEYWKSWLRNSEVDVTDFGGGMWMTVELIEL